jgi:peroxiredoxin
MSQNGISPTPDSNSGVLIATGAKGSRRAAFAAYVLVAALFAGGGAMALRARATAVPVAAADGARAPGFELEVLGKPGERLALSDLRGKPALVVFNCGCKLCYDFNRAFREVAPRMKDLQPVGIMMNHYSYSPDQIRNFRETTGFKWPLLIDHESGVTLTYDSDDCPRVWLVDRDGIIRYHNKSNEEPAPKIIADLLAAYNQLP